MGSDLRMQILSRQAAYSLRLHSLRHQALQKAWLRKIVEGLAWRRRLEDLQSWRKSIKGRVDIYEQNLLDAFNAGSSVAIRAVISRMSGFTGRVGPNILLPVSCSNAYLSRPRHGYQLASDYAGGGAPGPRVCRGTSGGWDDVVRLIEEDH